jgi:hypothetical protein
VLAASIAALLVAAGPAAAAGSRVGSAAMRVSVVAVAPLRARAPEAVSLETVPAASGSRQIARVRPVAAMRGGAPVVLASESGAPARACEGSSCEVPLAPGASDGAVVVLTFLPDGEPTAIVER